MTNHAAAHAADRERNAHPGETAVPVSGTASAPTLLMFGALDAPNCDGDGCVVPFAAQITAPTNTNTDMDKDKDMEGSPE